MHIQTHLVCIGKISYQTICMFVLRSLFPVCKDLKNDVNVIIGQHGGKRMMRECKSQTVSAYMCVRTVTRKKDLFAVRGNSCSVILRVDHSLESKHLSLLRKVFISVLFCLLLFTCYSLTHPTDKYLAPNEGKTQVAAFPRATHQINNIQIGNNKLCCGTGANKVLIR